MEKLRGKKTKQQLPKFMMEINQEYSNASVRGTLKRKRGKKKIPAYYKSCTNFYSKRKVPKPSKTLLKVLEM